MVGVRAGTTAPQTGPARPHHRAASAVPRATSSQQAAGVWPGASARVLGLESGRGAGPSGGPHGRDDGVSRDSVGRGHRESTGFRPGRRPSPTGPGVCRSPFPPPGGGECSYLTDRAG